MCVFVYCCLANKFNSWLPNLSSKGHAPKVIACSKYLTSHPSFSLLLFQDPDAVDCSGNVLLNRFAGAKILLLPSLPYEGAVINGKQTTGLKDKMQDYVTKLK